MVLVVFGAGGAAAGCGGPSSPPPPDGGPARVIELVSPAQFHLGYGESMMLTVRYHEGDTTMRPVGGATLRFAIFDDPGGSTLAADHATTADDGTASVRLVAGAQRTMFRVRVSADGARDADFGVAVTDGGVVDLLAELTWPPLDQPSAASATTLRALLYVGRACATLPVAAQPQPAARELETVLGTDQTSATLGFLQILSQPYAVVGRAEDAGGRLVGSGCVDIPAAALPVGVQVDLPVPLAAPQLSLAGTYALQSTLTESGAALTAQVADWRTYGQCPAGVAQELLDATVGGLGATLAQAVAQKRGPLDANGCRPTMLPSAGGPSLDAQLQALLTVAGAPAADPAGTASDVEALIASVALASTIELTVAGPAGVDGQEGAVVADHALSALHFGAPGGTLTVDLAASLRPVVEASGVAVTRTATGFALAAHGFTLELAEARLLAVETVALAPRAPTVMPQPPSLRAFVGAVTQAAQHGGRTGCGAVEDLVCAVIGGGGCTGQVEPACTSGLDVWAARLSTPFPPSSGLDWEVAGTVTASDADGDLVADTLTSGSWTATTGPSGTFTGMRTP